MATPLCSLPLSYHAMSTLLLKLCAIPPAAGQSPLAGEQPSLSNRYKLNDQTWELIKDSVGAIDDKLTFTVYEGKPVSYSRREVTVCPTMLAWTQPR